MKADNEQKFNMGGGYLNNTLSTVFIYTKTHIKSMCFLCGEKEV